MPFTCSLCGKDSVGWGHNPAPLIDDVDARCCDDCNRDRVIPARLGLKEPLPTLPPHNHPLRPEATVPHALHHGGPFGGSDQLPFDAAEAADRAFAADGYEVYTHEGERLIIVADTYLAKAATAEGVDFNDATAEAWQIQRADGRKAYIWKAPQGIYGTGKPMRPQSWSPSSN